MTIKFEISYSPIVELLLGKSGPLGNIRVEVAVELIERDLHQRGRAREKRITKLGWRIFRSSISLDICTAFSADDSLSAALAGPSRRRMRALFANANNPLARVIHFLERDRRFLGRRNRFFERVSSLLGRVSPFLDRANRELERVSRFLGRFSSLLEPVRHLLDRVSHLLGRANRLLGRANRLLGRAS